MKLLNAVIFSCVSLAFIFVNGAEAENRAGAVSVSPLIGGYVFDSDQTINNDLSYGIVLGYNITKQIGIEGAFNYVATDVDLATLTNSVDVYAYRLEGLYHFMPDKDLLPYIAAGFGGITFDVDGICDDTDFLVNYGGGIKYFFTDSIAVRAGVRHIMSFDDTNHNILYKVGLSYLFGSYPKKNHQP